MKHSESNSALLQSILNRFIEQHKLAPSYAKAAQKWFIPLANRISEHQASAGSAIIVGINGCQGSGKSTLTSLLATVLNEVFHKSTIGFSIDDFYLSKEQRIRLSKSVNPLLKTRGAPGTHDIGFLESTLTLLLNGKNVDLPVFNKALDDLAPVSKWIPVNEAPKIIILEGWCVGIDSQHQSELAQPINELEALEDTSKDWRQYVNDVLSVDYKRVFSLIDYMIMLKAPSFEHVYKWRCEQEHKLIKSLEGNADNKIDASGIMSDEQILRFVQFYQRLTEHALTSMPAKCDSLFTLNSSRSVKACRHK